jgi:hypothetical protein
MSSLSLDDSEVTVPCRRASSASASSLRARSGRSAGRCSEASPAKQTTKGGAREEEPEDDPHPSGPRTSTSATPPVTDESRSEDDPEDEEDQPDPRTAASGPADHITVMCRFRPENRQELAMSPPSACVQFDDHDHTRVALSLEAKFQQYQFDRVFQPHSNQEDIYEAIGVSSHFSRVVLLYLFVVQSLISAFLLPHSALSVSFAPDSHGEVRAGRVQCRGDLVWTDRRRKDVCELHFGQM